MATSIRFCGSNSEGSTRVDDSMGVVQVHCGLCSEQVWKRDDSLV
jgi:transcription elongation factor Elf1